MPQPKPPLLKLPPELLLEVARYIPTDAIISLKLTHRTLNTAFPSLPLLLQKQPLSECSRFAIERLLCPPDPDTKRCFVCRKRYPAYMFSSTKSPVCAPPSHRSTPSTEIVDLPSFFCAWHVGRLVRIVRTESGGRNEWVSDVKRMCVHLGCIQGWEKCGCGCECESCGVVVVRTYTRYLNNERECKGFTFWRKVGGGAREGIEGSRGELRVREECVDGVRSTLDFPVRYERTVKIVESKPLRDNTRSVDAVSIGWWLFSSVCGLVAIMLAEIRSLWKLAREIPI
ncbi:unnamed protein product [Periconia digitata]|uniref:F-box domain-containing protein n=1 Tax=Periconia digitata TaxID=1303443 RepID=A0A9W4ULU6_9PLEO|nr:unnamed protein product [Periconia digitata]